MWNWSNSSGALFLQTGDMSEKAVGYTTMGGDLEGALSVIANVPKTVVVALLERLHARFEFGGIAATLATEPGPELADAQEAERELMPFPVLDACLQLYAGEKMSRTRWSSPFAASSRTQDGERLALGHPLHEAVHAVDLQMGAVAALPPRRFTRSRPRARAADAGRAEDRVVGRISANADDLAIVLRCAGSAQVARCPRPLKDSGQLVISVTSLDDQRVPVYRGWRTRAAVAEGLFVVEGRLVVPHLLAVSSRPGRWFGAAHSVLLSPRRFEQMESSSNHTPRCRSTSCRRP